MPHLAWNATVHWSMHQESEPDDSTPNFNTVKSFIYRVTKKKGTFEKPNKNWRNPRKKNVL